MIVTEKEAKTKWCPMVNLVEGSVLGDHEYNRPAEHNHPYCIITACMAWNQDVHRGDKGSCGLALNE